MGVVLDDERADLGAPLRPARGPRRAVTKAFTFAASTFGETGFVT